MFVIAGMFLGLFIGLLICLGWESLDLLLGVNTLTGDRLMGVLGLSATLSTAGVTVYFMYAD